MQTIVTRDVTALSAMRMDAKTGKPTRTKLLTGTLDAPADPRITRPNTRKARTGMPIEPSAPIGSRRKTLVSIHVSFHNPCNMAFDLVANRVAGQGEEHVLQTRNHRA